MAARVGDALHAPVESAGAQRSSGRYADLEVVLAGALARERTLRPQQADLHISRRIHRGADEAAGQEPFAARRQQVAVSINVHVAAHLLGDLGEQVGVDRTRVVEVVAAGAGARVDVDGRAEHTDVRNAADGGDHEVFGRRLVDLARNHRTRRRALRAVGEEHGDATASQLAHGRTTRGQERSRDRRARGRTAARRAAD